MSSRAQKFGFAIILIPALFMITACSNAGAPTSVKGKVVDSATGLPVGDAVVEYGKVTVHTDQNGSFSLENTKPGSTIVVLKPGYESKEVQLGTQGILEVSLTPAEPAAKVSGVVIDSSTGNPIQGVIVTDGFYETVTDEKGNFELAISTGTSQLVFSAEGTEQKEVPPDTVNPMHVSLNPLPRPVNASNFKDRLPPNSIKEAFLKNANFPVSFVFTPDGRMFYNELRTGKIRVVQNGVLLDEPLYDFDVALQPETGLIGLELDPDFRDNHYLYVYYTESGTPGEDSLNLGPNQVVRLTETNNKGTDLTILLPDLPSGLVHNSGNIHFGPDGKLYVTVGNTDNDSLSQDVTSLAGKILRLNHDGSMPEDNPMLNVPGARPEIYAYGFRNSFDFSFHPLTGQMWATENGPGDNDELNLVLPGRDYGWPPAGFQHKPGLEDPVMVFNPVIAPTGIEFYRGGQIPIWQNNLFIASYHQGILQRMLTGGTNNNQVIAEDFVTPDALLCIKTGPDGALYFSSIDAIYRIRPSDKTGLSAVAEAVPPSQGPTPSAPTTITTPSASGQVEEIQVKLTEWAINLSRDTVCAGRVRFMVENDGNAVHALAIRGEGVNASTPDLPGGQTQILEVSLVPGVYQLDCPVDGHSQLGMHTQLTVLNAQAGQ